MRQTVSGEEGRRSRTQLISEGGGGTKCGVSSLVFLFKDALNSRDKIGNLHVKQD